MTYLMDAYHTWSAGEDEKSAGNLRGKFSGLEVGCDEGYALGKTASVGVPHRSVPKRKLWSEFLRLFIGVWLCTRLCVYVRFT